MVYCYLRSLVQTNDHLLRELNEARRRHDEETRQLHWNYDQLKRSMSENAKRISLNGSNWDNQLFTNSDG